METQTALIATSILLYDLSLDITLVNTGPSSFPLGLGSILPVTSSRYHPDLDIISIIISYIYIIMIIIIILGSCSIEGQAKHNSIKEPVALLKPQSRN